MEEVSARRPEHDSGRATRLKRRGLFINLTLCAVLALAWMWYSSRQGAAEEPSKYVGAETCLKCHKKVATNWAMTVHRRTLFNTDPSKKGCEGCHGPGAAHVAGGGDPTEIIRPERLKPSETAALCMRCHTDEHVTLWRTSSHARAKLSCTNCHDSHSTDPKTLSKDIDSGKLQLSGLSKSIQEAEMAYNTALDKTTEKAVAYARMTELKQTRDKLQEELKGNETLFQRSAEPYICYNCHKAQKAQANLPSHHPIKEGKMNCSDCHNPHGGPVGNLKAESVNETCFRCHAEKVGPFTYDHPPVTEDCTICHNPHGSVNNNLLVQSQPFLCLKCHPGPHSRRASLGAPKTFANYYTQCTNCHTQVHGSDAHAALHY